MDVFKINDDDADDDDNEVVIGPNVKLECVPKFCYLGNRLGAGGGVEEVARMHHTI